MKMKIYKVIAIFSRKSVFIETLGAMDNCCQVRKAYAGMWHKDNVSFNSYYLVPITQHVGCSALKLKLNTVLHEYDELYLKK